MMTFTAKPSVSVDVTCRHAGVMNAWAGIFNQCQDRPPFVCDQNITNLAHLAPSEDVSMQEVSLQF